MENLRRFTCRGELQVMWNCKMFTEQQTLPTSNHRAPWNHRFPTYVWLNEPNYQNAEKRRKRCVGPVYNLFSVLGKAITWSKSLLEVNQCTQIKPSFISSSLTPMPVLISSDFNDQAAWPGQRRKHPSVAKACPWEVDTGSDKTASVWPFSPQEGWDTSLHNDHWKPSSKKQWSREKSAACWLQATALSVAGSSDMQQSRSQTSSSRAATLSRPSPVLTQRQSEETSRPKWNWVLLLFHIWILFFSYED